MTLRVVFRADASLEIGSGHVARCLTLAALLAKHGCDCRFICREHPGNMILQIEQQGFAVTKLEVKSIHGDDGDAYSGWLGDTWQDDAQATIAAIGPIPCDWLVVDHYALDFRWEKTVSQVARKLLAIDDLAERAHSVDVLVDQNLGRQPAHYGELVPAHCAVLAGPRYALLREEFALARQYSLRRRINAPLQGILVSMGGIDRPDATSVVLRALSTCLPPEGFVITVVMGAAAPWINEVRALAGQLSVPATVLTGISNMAEQLANADLAIGAAGGSAWERACLGVPTMLAVLAPNQYGGALAIADAGAGILLGDTASIAHNLPAAIAAIRGPDVLAAMSARCAALVDGLGSDRVVEAMGVSHE